MENLVAHYDWENEIKRRRAVFLDRLFAGAVVFGLIALFLATRPDEPTVLGFLVAEAPYIAVWLLVVLAWRWKGLGYAIRVTILLLVSYALAIYIFFDSGLHGSARVWMLILPAVTFILAGAWAGVVASVFSILAYAVFSSHRHQQLASCGSGSLFTAPLDQ